MKIKKIMRYPVKCLNILVGINMHIPVCKSAKQQKHQFIALHIKTNFKQSLKQKKNNKQVIQSQQLILDTN